jgi:hypothetical protein
MGKLNTNHLLQCIKTLESSLDLLNAADPNSVEYEVFRNATVKGFELTLETSGNLLRKVLKTYIGNPRAVDGLVYKDLFRHAAKHGLFEPSVVNRWFLYRDNRNDTAHDYGIGFANTTLTLLPQFIKDAQALQQVLQQKLEDHAKP